MGIDGSSSKCARPRADIEELIRDADLHPHPSKTTSPISWIGVAITAKQEKQRKTVMRVLFVFGTRPEAIKLCPLVHQLRSRPDRFQVKVCVTAQHRDMLDQVMEVFSVRPDFDLNLMQPDQTLSGLTARILAGVEPILK